jgi:hypothetical protein
MTQTSQPNSFAATAVSMVAFRGTSMTTGLPG